MATPRLVTITFSHFCEKARWGLERAGVDYVEDGHLPLYHWIAVRRAGARRMVPVLVTDDGILSDSTEILQWADARAPAGRRLYPEPVAAEALALEEGFDRDLGPATRRWAYGFLLKDAALVREVARLGAPRWERASLPWVFPFARVLMRKGMRIDDAGVGRSRRKIDEVFGRVDALLADGRRYLTGEALTAADITFAALAAPAIFPAEYSTPFPAIERFPAATQAEIAELRRRPAGAFALRVFAESRRADAP